MEEQFRELSRAIALHDWQGAAIILDLLARDRPSYEEPIALGRVDADNIRRRDAAKKPLRKAA